MLRFFAIRHPHNDIFLARKDGHPRWTNDERFSERFENSVDALAVIDSQLRGEGRVVLVSTPPV